MRCINIDWLECYCLEPTRPRDAGYFRAAGYVVKEREYGTRVYAEMFTLEGSDGFNLLEIRRRPLSRILEPYACHIRLCNRTCYYDDAVAQLSRFLAIHQFEFRRISRIDIALDFEKFDSGDDPQVFIRRYMKGKYAKINQSNISAHGRDDWSAREWNSISWGSPSSPIGTKMYNKTLELAQVKDKPYIRQAWFLAGLVDNPQTLVKRRPDGQQYNPTIWRIEFSIRSDVRGWVTVELDGKKKNYRSIRNTLAMYDSRDKLEAMFASLAEHYFHFKHYEEGKNKYKCLDKQLFAFSNTDTHYSVEKVASPLTRDNELATLATRLRHYRDTHIARDIRDAADVLIQAITNEDLQRYTASGFRRAELLALQDAIARRAAGDQRDPAAIIEEVLAFIGDARDIF